MRRLWLLALVITLVGCKQTVREESPVLHELATVLQAVYTPSEHKLGLGRPMMEDLTGVGTIDWRGNSGIPISDDLQINVSTVPEKYAIVFQCTHGQFIVERHDIYTRFKDLIGARVDVTYKELYAATYEQRDGERICLERVLVDFDFLNAVLAGPQTSP